MIKQLTKQENKKLFNQRLQRVHIALGIGFSFLMYVALFFGMFAILLPYIQNWEKPISHIKIVNPSSIDYDSILNQVLKDDSFPKDKQIILALPNYMKEPTLKISAQFAETKIFNPNTNEELKEENTHFKLAQFLNYMHYGKLFGEFGWYVFGFMAVAGVVLIVGGVYQIFTLKYKNSSNSQTGFFSKWHRKILLWTALPFLLIVISGVFMNIGKKTIPIVVSVASKGETTNIREFAFSVVHPQDKKIEKSNQKVEMLSLNELFKKAQEQAPELIFHKIKLTNWSDSTATIKFEGYNPYMPFLNGMANIPNITLSGLDGSLINQNKVLDKNWGGIFYDIINYIHLLFVVDDVSRMVVFFIMLITTLAIGFGNMLYLEKKARRFPIDIPVYQGFGKLSLAVMLGVIPATALLFVLQWLLPFDLENKTLITKGVFATFWCFTFTYSFYRLNSYQTAKEFLYLGGVLFILSSIIHSINSGFYLLRLWKEEIYTIFAIDIGLIVLGLVLIFIAYKLPTQREKIQEFWTTRGVK
jgi:hypothetical protein